MQRQAEHHSRLTDPWRWASIVPVAGAIAATVVAVRRHRYGWAATIAAASITEVVAIVIAAEYHGPLRDNSAEGIGVWLWALVMVLCWMFPDDGAGSGTAWPSVTDRARELTARYGLIAYVATFAGTVALALILRAVGVHVGLGIGVVIVDAVLLASLVPLLGSGRLSARDLGLRGTRAGASAGWAVAALVGYVSLTVIWAVIVIHHHSASQSLAKQLGISRHPGAAAVIIDTFALAVSAPVTEEIFFRGLLFRSLRNRLPLWAAALIAGSLFGLVHITSYPLNTIPIKMLFGVLMCLLYERTGSLLPCIAVHSMVDGSSADALFTGNIALSASIAGVVLGIIILRSFVASGQSRPGGAGPTPLESSPAASEPGAAWPPYLRDE